MSKLVLGGVQLTILAGDADFVCNWYGNRDVADAVTWPSMESFQDLKLVDYKVDGVSKGTFKQLRNLAFVRVFDAGHSVGFDRKLSYPLPHL